MLCGDLGLVSYHLSTRVYTLPRVETKLIDPRHHRVCVTKLTITWRYHSSCTQSWSGRDLKLPGCHATWWSGSDTLLLGVEGWMLVGWLDVLVARIGLDGWMDVWMLVGCLDG